MKVAFRTRISHGIWKSRAAEAFRRISSDVTEARNTLRAWQRHSHPSWQFRPELPCCKASRPNRSSASWGWGGDVRSIFFESEVANCAPLKRGLARTRQGYIGTDKPVGPVAYQNAARDRSGGQQKIWHPPAEVPTPKAKTCARNRPRPWYRGRWLINAR